VSDDTPTPADGRDPRDIARLVAAIVVIAAFVALAALAIAASRSSIASSAPAPAGSRDEPTQPVPAEQALLAVVSAPVAGPTPTPAVPVAAAPAAQPPDDVLPPVPAPEPETGKPCAALSLPAPQQVGGLQNLVRLIPLFGPFSPEAFAMLPAFQPGMDALGPLFPLFEQGLDAAAPVLDPLTVVLTQLSDAGFQALGPLYEPYRPAVLDGEAQLAAYLQPIVEQLATAPGSECLLALEGLLAELAP
jgi:hypothetical protein